ncbi:alpha/beta hydrolase [Actinomycetes bacterium KLBMP 9759]
MAMIDLAGVKTWYDERGAGDPLVLLHGGFSNATDFAGSLDTLADRFRLLMPERRGHGHTADVDGPITVQVMAQDTIAFLEEVAGGPAGLVGYSSGAGVALHVAVQRLDLVERLVLISGASDLDGLIVRPGLGGEFPEVVVDAYAAISPDGREHFPVVVEKVVRGMEGQKALTADELARVTCRTLVMSGDDDIVTLEHTIELYRGLPDAELAVVPRATHLLMFEKPALCAGIVGDFLTGDSAPTFMPIRRG